jgi:hypothetical protein
VEEMPIEWEKEFEAETPPFTMREEKFGGDGGILPKQPKNFPVLMVKLKSFVVNARIFQNPFCQCYWRI